MASTYSNLKIQLMGTGDNSGTWGNVTNLNLGTAIEQALVETAGVDMSSGDVTLTLTDSNDEQTARALRLNCTGATGASNLIVPAIEKPYIVSNAGSYNLTVKVSGQTGITIPAGKTMWVYNNGVDVIDAITHLSSLTLSSPLAVEQGGTGSNSATFSGANITDLNATSISTGTLDNARTSASSSNGASTIVARDASGNFSAGTISAELTGNVSGNVTGNVTGDVSGNVTGNLTGTASNATVLQTARNFEISNGATAAAVSFDGGAAVNLNVTGINASIIDTGTIANGRTTASSANGASTIVLRDASGDFSAHNVTANMVTGLISPVNSTDATNKSYVDSIVASGVHYHTPVRVESPINLTATYNNGTAGVGATLTNSGTQVALVIDGITLSVADRVLIYEQTDQTQNGVYVVSDVGSGATNWVLTRATDADTYGVAGSDVLGEGSAVFVQEGSTGAGETYVCNTTGTITFGTTNITFAQISSAQIYSANTSTGLVLTSTEFSIDVVPVANGGTGSNTATFSGANITDLNATSISTGTLDNARTSASSSNGASTIVARDASGDFSANTITANLTGTASNATVLQTARTIQGVSFNGSADITVVTAGTGITVVGTAVSIPQAVATDSNVQFGSLGVGTAASGTTGEIRATNNVTAYYSDDRLKTKLGNIDSALDKVCALNGFYYEANETAQALGYEAKKEVGVSAQEVQAIMPEVVAPAPIDDKYLTVRYERLIPLLLEAIKELKAEVDALKKG